MPEGPVKTDLAGELAAFRVRHPSVTAVDAIFADLCCITRGKRLPMHQAERLFDPGIGFAGSTFLPVPVEQDLSDSLRLVYSSFGG